MLELWLKMAIKFIIRHKRKTIATGSFIIVGTAILIIMQGITTGINDTMVVNTTRLHFGDIYTIVDNTSKIDETLSIINKRINPENILVRHQLTVLAIFNKSGEPLQAYGIDPEKESAITAINNKIIRGNYPQNNKKEILIGNIVANKLDVNIGNMIKLLDKRGKSIGFYKLSGIFETGINHIDSLAAFIPHSAIPARALVGTKAEISIFIDNSQDVEKITSSINSQLNNGIQMKSWKKVMPDLVQLIELNKTSMTTIMLFVYLLVGFGIGNNFVLTIMERFREFGILKAMGVTPKEIILLVFLESMILCSIAVFIGIATGLLLTTVLSSTGIDFSSMTSHNKYFVVTGMVYPRVAISGVIISALFAFVISLVASYLPTRIVSKKIAAETMRF